MSKTQLKVSIRPEPCEAIRRQRGNRAIYFESGLDAAVGELFCPATYEEVFASARNAFYMNPANMERIRALPDDTDKICALLAAGIPPDRMTWDEDGYPHYWWDEL